MIVEAACYMTSTYLLHAAGIITARRHSVMFIKIFYSMCFMYHNTHILSLAAGHHCPLLTKQRQQMLRAAGIMHASKCSLKLVRSIQSTQHTVFVLERTIVQLTAAHHIPCSTRAWQEMLQRTAI
jgi:hypothetical protein